MPRLLATAAGNAFCVFSASCACGELADPALVTVTEASTLRRLEVVAMGVPTGSPRSATTDAVSTVGAAREPVEVALRVLVTVKVALLLV